VKKHIIKPQENREKPATINTVASDNLVDTSVAATVVEAA